MTDGDGTGAAEADPVVGVPASLLKAMAEAMTRKSEALQLAELHVELVRSLKGAEGWEVLGRGVERVAALLEEDFRTRRSGPPAAAPGPEEGPTHSQLARFAQLLALAKETYPSMTPEDGIRSVLALGVETARRERTG